MKNFSIPQNRFMRFFVFAINFFLTSTIFSCSKKKNLEFALKFEDIKQELEEKFEKADETLAIKLEDIFQNCLIPLYPTDSTYISSIPQKNKAPLTFHLEKFGFDLAESFFLSHFLEECQTNTCQLAKDKTNYDIKEERKKLQEGYEKSKIEINSQRGNIIIDAFYPPIPTQVVSIISIESASEKKASFKFASSITLEKPGANIVELESVVIYQPEGEGEKKISCYSKTKITGETRNLEIKLVKGNKKNFVQGYIKSEKDCPQKPFIYLSSNEEIFASEAQNLCDSFLPTSSLEILALKIKEKAEEDNTYLEILEKISDKFQVMQNELNFIKISNNINEIFQNLSIIRMLFDDEYFNSITQKIYATRDMLKRANFSIHSKLKIQLSENFSVDITYTVNPSTIMFFDLIFQYFSAAVDYISSLERDLPENTKNLIVQRIRNENLTKKEMMNILVSALNASRSFLKTKDEEKRKKALYELENATSRITDFIYQAQKEKVGLIKAKNNSVLIGDKILISSETSNYLFKTPITEIFHNFVEHKDLYPFLFLVKDVIYGLMSEENKNTLILDITEKIIKKSYYNVFRINLGKIILADLREILPAWTKDGYFAMEWECKIANLSPPISAENLFPENITCEGEIEDSPHFTKNFEFSEEITDSITQNPFFPQLPKDNILTRYPYIIFREPSFSGGLELQVSALPNQYFCQSETTKNFFFSPQGKEGICYLIYTLSFLLSE
jgi:hypothetical protein